MIKINRLRLFANMRSCDALLEKQGVDKEDHEGEEVSVEIVSSGLDLVCVEKDCCIGIQGSKILVRLNYIHVPRLDLVEEVKGRLPNALRSEFKLAPAGKFWILFLPDVIFLILLLLFPLSQLVELALEFGSAVNVRVCANIVPLSCHD